MADNPDSLVLLGVATDQLEANVWRDILDKEGIGIFVKDADPLSVTGITPSTNSLQVFVKAADEKRARWLLGDGTAAE